MSVKFLENGIYINKRYVINPVTWTSVSEGENGKTIITPALAWEVFDSGRYLNCLDTLEEARELISRHEEANKIEKELSDKALKEVDKALKKIGIIGSTGPVDMSNHVIKGIKGDLQGYIGDKGADGDVGPVDTKPSDVIYINGKKAIRLDISDLESALKGFLGE